MKYNCAINGVGLSKKELREIRKYLRMLGNNNAKTIRTLKDTRKFLDLHYCFGDLILYRNILELAKTDIGLDVFDLPKEYYFTLSSGKILYVGENC